MALRVSLGSLSSLRSGKSDFLSAGGSSSKGIAVNVLIWLDGGCFQCGLNALRESGKLEMIRGS